MPETCPEPQAVVNPVTASAIFIVATINPGEEHACTIRDFRNFDMRAMVGFVDGTENPQGRDATRFTIIGDEDTAFAGGSYVVVQKYLHGMQGWNALSVETQERIIGRRKLSDIELEPGVKPSNSEFGTYFIGYARSPAPIEQMLENMFVGRPPGNYDRLLDFSRAVTGGLFFIPSADMLEALVAPGAQAAFSPGAAAPDAAGSGDGSLNIGSLKEKPQERGIRTRRSRPDGERRALTLTSGANDPNAYR